MTSLLTWRSGAHADRQLLPRFECAEKGERSIRTGWKPQYPRPWEYEVQSAVRSLRPPTKPPWFLLVGEDEHGLGAVSYRTEVSGPEQVHLELLAVANRHRRQGGGVGDELAQTTLDEIIDRAIQAELEHVKITAHVHPENKASQHLCERMEFGVTGVADSGYDVWSAELYIAVD